MNILIKENDIEVLYPLTITRAAFDINVGGYTLYNIIREFFPDAKINFKVRDIVKEITEEKYSNQTIDDNKDNTIIVDARAVPCIENMKKLEKGLELDLIEFPHEIVILNKKICKENLKLLSRHYGEEDEGVFVGENVEIGKHVILDTSSGPIILDDESKISHFSYIQGPVYIGKKTKIVDHSSIKENVIIGNVCKIGGEVEESVIMDYTNKQHYGFLGNSVLGSWVNLGAGTSNSDLKNTYGEITVINGKEEKIKTKEQFLGCVIGDYSKTAINTSLFTGKVIGINCVLYGMVTKNIISFVNYTNQITYSDSIFILDKAIEVQNKVFSRRNIKQNKYHKEILKDAFKITKKSRDMSLKA